MPLHTVTKMGASRKAAASERKKLGEILVEGGMITPHQLQAALRSQEEYGGRLGSVLVRLGFITERNLVMFLKKHFELPGADLTKYAIEPDTLKLVPKDLAKRFQVLPLAVKRKDNKAHLFLAMSDPSNLEAIDEVQFRTGMIVHPVVAADGQLIDSIGIHYDGLSPVHMAELQAAITLDETDDGEMVIFQKGNEVHVGKESPEAAASPQPTPDPLQQLKPSGSAPGPAAPNAGGSSDPMKAVLALAQLLIDRGIITKRDLIDKIKEF